MVCFWPILGTCRWCCSNFGGAWQPSYVQAGVAASHTAASWTTVAVCHPFTVSLNIHFLTRGSSSFIPSLLKVQLGLVLALWRIVNSNFPAVKYWAQPPLPSTPTTLRCPWARHLNPNQLIRWSFSEANMYWAAPQCVWMWSRSDLKKGMCAQQVFPG